MADKEEKTEIQPALSKTKVFLAWSGDNSKEVAKILRKYLPLLINAIDPYMSEEDIEKGKKWTPELTSNLDSSRCGIICITPENTQSQWLHYEAGALSKTVVEAETYVCPFLMGMKEPEYNGPLKMFQATTFNESEFYKLIKTMNSACGKLGLDEMVLREAFNNYWKKIEERLLVIQENIKKQISKSADSESKLEDIEGNNIKSMLEELVVNTRSHSRQLSKIESEIERSSDIGEIDEEDQRIHTMARVMNNVMHEIGNKLSRWTVTHKNKKVDVHTQSPMTREQVKTLEAVISAYGFILSTVNDKSIHS